MIRQRATWMARGLTVPPPITHPAQAAASEAHLHPQPLLTSRSRRNLFGPADHVALGNELQAEEEAIRARHSHTWNFDFVADRPADGAYQWMAVGDNGSCPSVDTVPPFAAGPHRKRLFSETDDGEAEQLSAMVAKGIPQYPPTPNTPRTIAPAKKSSRLALPR